MFSLAECALIDANGRLKRERNVANQCADRAREHARAARFDADGYEAEIEILEEENARQAKGLTAQQARITELEQRLARVTAVAQQAIATAEQKAVRVRQLEKQLAAQA